MTSLAHRRLLCALSRAFDIASVAALFAVTSCAGAAADATGASGKTPDALVVVQGADQSAQAGKDLPAPILFRVLDAAGGGMHGITVTLSVVAGGGTVTPASDTTDARGEFKAKWTLGPSSAKQGITAAVPGVAPVPVNATGLLPTQIILVQGNNQTAKAGAVVTNSITVKVVGIANVPMLGVTVGFQVLTGGGGMTPLTVTTNALGEASTKWTLGAVGANTALATSGTLTPVALNATATP